jgi:hypothetical protein
MPEMCVSRFRIVRLSEAVALAAIVFTPSAASAQTSLGSAQPFAALGGTAITCTASTITGDVGVWPGNAVTKTGCAGTGTVHAGDVVAKAAYTDFINAYTKIATNPPACRATLTGTLTGQVLLPGVYCVDAVAKAGTLMLDAQGNRNATWTFLVNGALTGTSFKVMMLNGGQPCNVTWWVKDASTFTTSNVLGTILSDAGITFTGER